MKAPKTVNLYFEANVSVHVPTYFSSLQKALIKYCQIYEAHFREPENVTELHEVSSDGSADLVLTDSPENVRRKLSRPVAGC